MNCRHVRQLLSMARDGRAVEKQEAALTTHLRDCPACRQFQHEIAALGGKLRTAGEWEPAPRRNLRGRALEHWAAGQERSRRQPWSFLRALLFPSRAAAFGTVAVLVLVLIAGLLMRQRSSRSGTTIARGIASTGASIGETRAPSVPRGRSNLAPAFKPRKAAPRSQKHGPTTSQSSPEPTPVRSRPSQHPAPQRAPGATASPGHPRAHAAPGHGIPDTQYLDGRDPSLLARWSAAGGEEQERLAAILKRLPPPADDFASIPYPQIAGLGGAAIAAAVQQYKDEAKVVDTRLFRKVTLQDKGTALSDFCAELQEQTGVKLTASRTVADEKVTVFVKEEPARDVMRAVSHLFGYFWLRSGQEGEYRYELDQDLKSQLAEEEMRGRDQDAALIAMDQQAQAFRPYVDLSYDEFRKRWEQLPRSEQRPLGNAALNGGWGAMELYHHLTPRDRDALIAGQEVVFRPGDADPDHRLSADFDHKILMAWNPRVAGEERPVGELPGNQVRQVRLKLDRNELGQLSLTMHMTVTWKGQFGDSMTFDDLVLATGRSPSVEKPGNSGANAGLRSQSPFDRLVSLNPKPSFPAVKELGHKYVPREDDLGTGFDPSQPHATSADVWEAVHQATGLPVVADFYTRMFPLNIVTVEHKPLFGALCTLGDALGVRWRKEGGFILGRSTSYFWDKVKEVPNRYLQRWVRDRDASGGLPFADFLEMASMPDQQLGSAFVSVAIRYCWRLPEWGFVSGGREIEEERERARFLSILTPEQLQRALEPAGLPFQALTPAQQRAAIQRGDETTKLMEWQNGSADPVRPDWWPHAVIYAEYIPDGWYAWMPPDFARYTGPWNGPTRPFGGRTAAEALAAVRRVYPAAIPQEVQLLKDGHFSSGFRFEFRGG